LEGHSVAITIPERWVGRAGNPAARHLFALGGRMVVFGHSSSGLIHILDRARVGVMPILERALGL